MKEHRIALAAVIALVVLAGTAMTVRRRAMRRERITRGDTFWRVTYDVDFTPSRPGVPLRVALPIETPHARVLRETFARVGVAMDVLPNERTRSREAVVVARETGIRARVSAEFDVHLRGPGERPWPTLSVDEERLSATDRVYWLRRTDLVQVQYPRVVRLAAAFRKGTKVRVEQVTRIFEHCSEQLLLDNERGASDAASVLETQAGTARGIARAMVALARACGIPARTVAGFVLVEEGSVRPHVWVEVRPKNRWLPFDPSRGYAGEVPQDYLPIRLDGATLVRASGDSVVEARYRIDAIPAPHDLLVAGAGRVADVFILTRLPYGMQGVLAILLLLPIGTLVTALFRNVVGIQTFGTFTPALLALTFIHADWHTGAAVLAVVVLLGLLGRRLLEGMKLLMVPRLSIILTLVVLAMALTVSAMDHFRLTPSARAVLLPMVILTMLIERFHISSEEDGTHAALKLLAGTGVVSVCCFLVLRWAPLGRLVLSFPEALLVIAAALILIGRYSGYRLSELWRFRDLARGKGAGA